MVVAKSTNSLILSPNCISTTNEVVAKINTIGTYFFHEGFEIGSDFDVKRSHTLVIDLEYKTDQIHSY